MHLIDTHCHFDSGAFDGDRSEVFSRAQEAGVSVIISPAITRNSWAGLKSISTEYDGVFPAYGLHPMFLDEHSAEDLSYLEKLVEKERPLAIGECGLDFYIKNADKDAQRFYFQQQLALAAEFDLPVIIHARKAVEDVLLMLREFPSLTGVMHSYSGSVEQARLLIGRGFYLGFGGPLTWERSTKLRKTVKSLPLSSLLLETDAPDQPGQKNKGKRNEPAWLHEVAETIAELHGIPVKTVVDVTTKNAARLFSIPTN